MRSLVIIDLIVSVFCGSVDVNNESGRFLEASVFTIHWDCKTCLRSISNAFLAAMPWNGTTINLYRQYERETHVNTELRDVRKFDLDQDAAEALLCFQSPWLHSKNSSLAGFLTSPMHLHDSL